MGICPFFKESVWSGNKCQASGDGDGAPIQRRYANYCGANVMSDDYHNCPLYKDATVNITVRQSRQSGVARATCPD